MTWKIYLTKSRLKARLAHIWKKCADKRIKNLLAYFQNQSTKPFAVLDIGGGVAHFELLKSGLADNIVGVDASSSYIESAKQSAGIHPDTDRVRYIRRDFAQSPDSIPQS